MSRSHETFVRRRILAVDLISGTTEFPSDIEPIPLPRNARVLVRIHDHPIGTVEVDEIEGGVPSVDIVRKISWEQLQQRIAEHLVEDGLELPNTYQQLADLPGPVSCSLDLGSVPKETPLITISIATMDNVESCSKCIARVLGSNYESLEVLVVDNAPELGHTEEMVANFDDRVRYAPEPRRGLSRARNKGIAEARGEIVVFIDDDVIVDKFWLNAIAHNFSCRPEVACVTGAIVAAEHETPAQQMLEQYGGFNKGSRRQVYDMKENRRDSPLYPFDAGRFGSGANIALRKSVVKELGNFAETLGAGTKTHGGEDIDILQRVVSSGHTLIYEPAALMWHFHRRTYSALERQMFRYGVGFSATVMKWLFEPHTAVAVAGKLPAGFKHALNPKSVKNSQKNEHFPNQLTWLERAGMLVGPFSYLRSRFSIRHR